MTTWEDRDLPVLTAVLEMAEKGRAPMDGYEIAEYLGWDELTVQRSLVALAGERPPFFEFTDTTDFDSDGQEISGIHSPTGHARRAVGAWPTPESLAERLVAALEKAAADAEPEQAGHLRKTALWLRENGQAVALGVVGNALSKGIGL
ncbi:hypothetical protein Aph01nite_34420 [Acrocarpospora phusangensis]|uniref:Uncharacterized protein n=1 Tax=Acrocarpospora phusangensis TaxID=1070424 RepID=A0A919QA33_9ACTN|nr:hypothetical protein [Acrocarpospora phusangensis]GIH25132.1 hypothetical protein Aph01nite_34420 [Acrocarpospora phusangensis]